MDGETDVTKVIVAFSNFVKTPKNQLQVMQILSTKHPYGEQIRTMISAGHETGMGGIQQINYKFRNKTPLGSLALDGNIK
jgi:hypothetical protein